MGILNITPDSYADGGKFFQQEAAIKQALLMQQQGADIIDVGGESTRPYAKKVSLAEELDRVIPVIVHLSKILTIPISIDTYKPEVMEAAIAAGATFINDIFALRSPGALAVANKYQVPVCLMHMQGDPQTMQDNPQYENVIDEIIQFFAERIEIAEASGIKRELIILDPGFGFGKTVQHNLQVIKHLQTIKDHFKLPILIGVSRKATIGKLLNDAPCSERLYGSIALTSFAIANGADIIRTHDVAATRDALAVTQALGFDFSTMPGINR